MDVAHQLADAGLGLDHDALQLAPTTDAWISAGSRLRDRVARQLASHLVTVEQIGSSAVLDLLAKPIVDLAVGAPPSSDLDAVTAALVDAGWIYRGDAGDDGGHVFVLEARSWHRVAHIHVVAHGGPQWRHYLELRDLLRRSAAARQRYEAVKLGLLDEVGSDRKAYTDGKSTIVLALLDEARRERDRATDQGAGTSST